MIILDILSRVNNDLYDGKIKCCRYNIELNNFRLSIEKNKT